MILLIIAFDTIEAELENLLEKYRHQGMIKHKSLKCFFTGPPRVGKTTLKKRLLKIIKNLISSGVVSASGGLEKPITVILGETKECVTIVFEADRIDWQPQRNLLDEAQIVLEFIDQQPTHKEPSNPVELPLHIYPAPDVPQESMSVTFSPSEIHSMQPPPMEPEPDTLDDARKLMQEVLANRKLRSIKDIEKTTTIYLIDTGGQPEFHEIMPIIFQGPALHLVFFNLAFGLNEPILVHFCQQDGNDALITYKSSYTGKQMIYKLLSSLYYLSIGTSLHSEPAAALIGTHLDQLKNQERQVQKELQEINDSLKHLLSNTEFHDRGFLTYPKKDENIFIPVNNYSGGEEEIEHLQVFLRQIIDNRFRPVELPSSWLFFHLILRHRYESSPGVCRLAECRALAEGCGLDEDDVPQVLRYIHRHLGTILFYEEVQGMNELVICDPNMLFKSIYHLVAVSFAGDRVYHTSAAKVRKTGELPGDLVKRICAQPSTSLLTNQHILELLKHFKILTELSDGAYFMPCLLQPDYSLELSREVLQSLHAPPLLICFDGNYVPIGVFSALVVKFSQSSWEPDPDVRYHNHISFFTDGLSSVELMIYPSYLEFRIPIANHTEEEPKEIHQFCVEVRRTVVSTLKDVLDLHEHTKTVGFQLGFYCPGSFQAEQPHFGGCIPRHNHTNPKNLLCSKSPRCQGQCRLPRDCTIWFDYRKVTCSLHSVIIINDIDYFFL